MTSRTYELHKVCERKAVGRLVNTVTVQGLYIEAFLAVEMESVQRPGEQEHGVMHERHLSLQQRITGLSVLATTCTCSDSGLSHTHPHCVRSDSERPLVVLLLLCPGLDDKLHGAVLGVHEAQQGDVGVNGVEFAQIQRVGVLQ